MAGRLTRAQVAKELGVNPATILRWEKRGVSPVVPKRHVRTRQLIYSEDDIPVYRAWMEKTETATFKVTST
jgi:DNA-binding transcriptional MerR regulator